MSNVYILDYIRKGSSNMKPYGIPRVPELEYPDVGDIHTLGLKSSIGYLRGKGGDIKSCFRNSEVKRSIRRIYKKKARQEGKEACSIIE